MERILSESPHAWLLRIGVRDPLDVREIMGTFNGAAAVVEVWGGHFLRGAGHGRQPDGNWWVRKTDVAAVESYVKTLPDTSTERRNLLLRELRNRTAVCLNWNDLSAYWGMTVSASEPLTGLAGPAKPQPVWDSKTPGTPPSSLGDGSARMLPGGMRQYYFPREARRRAGIQVLYYGRPSGRSF